MRIETGDGWELRLGDCLDPETGLASLESVDHVITDPPYEAQAHTKQRRLKKTGSKAAKVIAAPLSFGEIGEGERAGLFSAVNVRRWAVAFCQAEAVQAWRDAMEGSGLVWKRACVWIKPDAQPQLTGDRPGMGYESMAVSHPPGRSRWNGGGKVGVYRFNKNRSDLKRTGHPTQKPLALMEALVSDFTNPGELICDPFAGSGTTGVACVRLGRRFIGWEKDPDFFEIAVKRLRGTREQRQLFQASDPGKQEGMF